MSDLIWVEFKDELLQGCVSFDTLGAAMGFIFGIQRKEKFDPKGRYARLVL